MRYPNPQEIQKLAHDLGAACLKPKTGEKWQAASDAFLDLANGLSDVPPPPPPEEPPPPPPPEEPPASSWPARTAVFANPTQAVSTNGFLQINDAQKTLENMEVMGGIDFYGDRLVLKNVIVKPDGRWWGGVVMRKGGSVLVVDGVEIYSTQTSVSDDGVLFMAGGRLEGRRLKVQGTADGLKFTNGFLEDSVIIALAAQGAIHNDGVQVMGGSDLAFRRCYVAIEATEGPGGLLPQHHNAALFFQPYPKGRNTIRNVEIDTCYLEGGYFPLRFERGTTGIKVRDTVLEPGVVFTEPGIEIVEWSNVKNRDGQPIKKP